MLAEKFDNEMLDPSTWAAMFGRAYNNMCTHNPSGFVSTDLTLFVIFVILILFDADIKKWWAERNLRAQGFEELNEEKEGDEDPRLSDEALADLFDEIDVDHSGQIADEEMEGAITKFFGKVERKVVEEMMSAADTDRDGEVSLREFKMIMRAGPKKLGAAASAMTDPDRMRSMLQTAREGIEEVDLMVRLRGEGIDPRVKSELKERRAKLDAQINTVNEFLSAMEVVKEEEALDLEAAAAAAEEAEAQKKREGQCGEMVKMGVTILKNTISGVLTIYLYFMDLISDYQVTMLYYNTGAVRFAFVSLCLLVGQFFVVYMRVLPYLHLTYGEDSLFYKMFLYLGFPFGCFFFDFLMFLGPFGLLPIAPLPESMKLFVPAYGATRMIAEVLVEALPQWLMQAIIFVNVSEHVTAGTASEVDMVLYKYQDGSFVSLMPKSILISSCTMLKTWFDLVQEAREAGVSVAQKGVQLWNVGHGLPLDAIKSGSIYAWKCQYEVSDQEIVSLVDALGKNESLTRLDLSLAGFEWLPPVAREERSALSSGGLLEVINGDAKALESLEKLIISKETKWEIPVGALRSGPSDAQKALLETPFLSKGGPERAEMQVMFELLCKNRSLEPGEGEIEVSFAAVSKVFIDSQKSGTNVKAKRTAWQASVAQLISKGMTRRAHFKVVIGTEVLRNVGFGVQELLDLGFTPSELKAGFFEARELHEAGFSAAALKDLGYLPKDLHAAEISVSEMKSLAYTARELREGGYTAQQMRNAQAYTLPELKEGRYKAVDLGEAGYLIPDLRAAGFTALDLRKAMIFTVQMMRDAGYTCDEMKKAGYDAKRIKEAGYNAIEANRAGYTVPQMFTAGFPAGGLRSCGHTALVLREAGYELMALLGANYNAEELVDAGYTVKEIKEAGTSLVQLKAAGTPMATLKDTGYTVERLKQQGYTAAELSSQSRGRVDLTHLGPTYIAKEVPWPCSISDDEGYTAKELRGGGVAAAELRKAKTFFRIEEWKDAAWPTSNLRDGGYSALEMKACGYTAKELHKHGYSVQDLVDGHYPIAELKAVGATAGELRQAKVSAKVLSQVGYTAKELLVAGFSAQELIECGFGVAELCEAGFDAIQLRALGFSARELKAYGYGAGALREAGSTVKELKELDFTDNELEAAGFTWRAIEGVNGMYKSVRELKDIGFYTVAELREYGFIVAEMRGIYTVKDLKDGGFSLDDLRAGGMPEHAVAAVDGRSTRELRKIQYTATILKKVGFLLPDLVEGGYTALELKRAKYGAAELKEVGFMAGPLREAGFTSKQLRAARYTLRDMQEGGYFWKDLVIFLRATHWELTNAGFTGLDPKHRLFLEYGPTDPFLDEIATDIGVSILGSPRVMGSPRTTEVSENTFLKVRQGVALTSKRVGVVAPSTKLRVLDSRVWRGDGSKRMLVGAAEAEEEGGAPQFLPIGWVTALPSYFKSVLGLGGDEDSQNPHDHPQQEDHALYMA